MAQQTVIKREVCESCIEFLAMEMVEALLRSSDSDLELAGFKLEMIGFRVGQKLAEKYTKDRPRFEEKKEHEKDLDIVKFICKDFWLALFKKQVDNLKTNHRDKYVISDSNFRMLRRFSADSMESTEKLAEKYLHFPRGLIRGALNIMGIDCEVRAEVKQPPAPNAKLPPPVDPKDQYGLACAFTILVKMPNQPGGTPAQSQPGAPAAPIAQQ